MPFTLSSPAGSGINYNNGFSFKLKNISTYFYIRITRFRQTLASSANVNAVIYKDDGTIIERQLPYGNWNYTSQIDWNPSNAIIAPGQEFFIGVYVNASQTGIGINNASIDSSPYVVPVNNFRYRFPSVGTVATETSFETKNANEQGGFYIEYEIVNNGSYLIYNNPESSTVLNNGSSMRGGDTLIFHNSSTGRSGTIFEWTVPKTGRYKIRAIGASGGRNISSNRKGGRGADITGEFNLNQGEVLRILVGQKGGDWSGGTNGGAGGGGGGTFVVKKADLTPLVIAGGGNGANWSSWTVNGVDALTTNARGDTSGFGEPTNSTIYGRGGGGGGFTNNGTGNANMGGQSFKNGGLGGLATDGYGSIGGFGGGGGSNHEGGGGGGYAGGHVSKTNDYNTYYSSYGATSYNAGENQVNQIYAVDNSHGRVEITLLNNPPSQPPQLISGEIGAGQTYDGLKEVIWSIGQSTDPDNDALTYELDFWDGSQWINIAKKVPQGSPTQVKMRLPNKNATGVKTRARAFDGKDFGPYSESGSFNIRQISNVQVPNALIFDGINDYIEFPQSSLWDVTNAFTIEVKVKTSWKPPSGENSVLLFGSFDQMFFEYRPSGNVDFYMTNTSSTRYGVNSQVDISDGKWHRLSVTYNGSQLKFYVDGVLQATNSASGNVRTMSVGIIGLSKIIGNPYLNYYFNGSLAQPRFYNRELTQTEIQNSLHSDLTGNETGLKFCAKFDTNTGRYVDIVTGLAATFYGGLNWGYTFYPLDNISLPSSNQYAKENIDYIRVKVNEFRQANGFPPYSWTDPVIIKKVTPVKAIHWNEIQAAIKEVYEQTSSILANQTVQITINETIMPKNPKYHIKELSSRVINIIKALKNEG
jgi:hypothetical protein